jgi:ribonuclease ZC3H12
MLKLIQNNRGYLITNISLKDVILDFTIYKQTIEKSVIRYRFQNENFQPLLVSIVNDHDGNDCERYYPLCPYGKKCTYGSKCRYFHIDRRYPNTGSIPDKSSREFSGGFNQIKSGPDHLHMYASSLAEDARMAYEYGLPSTPISNDFSFVDQRGPPMRAFTDINRSYSMPHPPFEQVGKEV